MNETIPGETYVAYLKVFGANGCTLLSNKSNVYTTGKVYPKTGFPVLLATQFLYLA